MSPRCSASRYQHDREFADLGQRYGGFKAGAFGVAQITHHRHGYQRFGDDGDNRRDKDDLYMEPMWCRFKLAPRAIKKTITKKSRSGRSREVISWAYGWEARQMPASRAPISLDSPIFWNRAALNPGPRRWRTKIKIPGCRKSACGTAAEDAELTQ